MAGNKWAKWVIGLSGMAAFAGFVGFASHENTQQTAASGAQSDSTPAAQDQWVDEWPDQWGGTTSPDGGSQDSGNYSEPDYQSGSQPDQPIGRGRMRTRAS